jgi:hypothetical protein
LAAATCFFFSPTPAQQRELSETKPGRSSGASCYDETGKLVGARKSRTYVLISPDGAYRAYAETSSAVRKRSWKNAGNELECVDTTRLAIAGPKSSSFHNVVVLNPTRETSANSIDVVDWSPTGHRLFLLQSRSQYGGDIALKSVRIYEVDRHAFLEGFSLDRALSKHVGKNCAAVIQPLGFSPTGQVVFSAEPYFDYGEDQPRSDSCVSAKSLWSITPPNSALKAVPESYQPQQYGKIASTAPRTE